MQTKLIGGGTAGLAGAELGIDPTFQAARVVQRPLDYAALGQILGHYRVGGKSGLMTGIAGAGPIFSFRWAQANAYAVIQQVKITGMITTAFTTPQVNDIDMIAARSFTASDTGGTALTPTGNTGKARTSMGTTQVADIRIATTAALGAGTRTLDASAMWIGHYITGNTAVTGAAPQGVVQDLIIYEPDLNAAQHPLVLALNEGFVLRIVTAQGAVGVTTIYVHVKWAEVVVF